MRKSGKKNNGEDELKRLQETLKVPEEKVTEEDKEDSKELLDNLGLSEYMRKVEQDFEVEDYT
jgi:hypothetical protein